MVPFERKVNLTQQLVFVFKALEIFSEFISLKGG